MRSDTPRYSKRSWRPPTDFDRPPLTESVDDLLAGVPESDLHAARQLAEHAVNGCLECRRNLDNLKETK